MSVNITMKQLLEAGTHFGHQTRRWNPKMKPYIFGARNGIYIINLQITMRLFRGALKFLRDSTADGKKVLFVGTKKQAQSCIQETAERCGMFFVTNRWLGGMLTNFDTIRKRIDRLNELEKMKDGGLFEVLPKKEVLVLERERKKLMKNLSGIKELKSLPDIIYLIDPKKETIALKEAAKLGIKVVAMVDTNCDPEGIEYVIPANDDAIRSIRLITEAVGDAINEGVEIGSKKEEEEAAKKAEKSAEPVASASGQTGEKREDAPAGGAQNNAGAGGN
jgi:small subunit ribosomal protein S2